MKKVKNILMYALIIFATMSYVFYTVYLLMHNSYILWTIDTSELNLGGGAKVFTYLKDLFAVILFTYVSIKYKKNHILAIIFWLLITYGYLILLVNGWHDIRFAMAGFRTYIYLVTAIMWCNAIENDSVYNIVFIILKCLLIVEFIFVFSQVVISNAVTYFGNGAYRFCGTFGNSGGLGNFALSVGLYIYGYSIKSKKSNKIDIMYLFICFLLTIASGMRSAILLLAAILMCYVIELFLKYTNFKRYSAIVAVLITIIGGYKFYNYIVIRVGRGKFMISGKTRIDILLNMFKIYSIEDLLSLLVGHGIGYGTNNATNLGLSATILTDSTLSTSIAQFGLLGAVLFFGILIQVSKSIWLYCRQSSILFACCYIGTIIVISFAGSIFEQIVMIMIITIIFFMMRSLQYNLK